MIGISRFRHVAIITNDIFVMVKFYRDILGFTLIREFEISSESFGKGIGIRNAKAKMAHLCVPNSDVELELFEFDRKRHSSVERELADDLGYRHIAFVVDDIDAAVAKLESHGVRFFSEPIIVDAPLDVAGFGFVYFRDPEGNIVELNKLPARP